MNQDIKNFRNHKIIFCDSEDSLKQSFKQGLRKDSLIRTSSPALLINKILKTKAIKPKINNLCLSFQSVEYMTKLGRMLHKQEELKRINLL